METVTNIHLNQKYRVVFEQAASTKGVLGFKVEANDDDEKVAMDKAMELLKFAKSQAPNQGM